MTDFEEYIKRMSDIILCYGMLQSCIGLAKIFYAQHKFEEGNDCCTFAEGAFSEIMKRVDNGQESGDNREDEVVLKF